MATREEIDRLKKDWEKDPCWDIDTTEGFEEHADELKAFQEEKYAAWDRSYERRIESEITLLREKYRDDPWRYIHHLEKRIAGYEELFSQVKILADQCERAGVICHEDKILP